MTTSIRVVHVSDLHFSEQLLTPPNLKAPHRYGHDVAALFELDSKLKDLKWDILLVSGDVTRVGSPDSFLLVRNWLREHITTGQKKFGLDLQTSGQYFAVVPGNHDRFNGHFQQRGLDGYLHEFPWPDGRKIQFAIGGVKVNIYLFDSTSDDGSFGHGEVKPQNLLSMKLNADELNMALIHHHFIQPPSHPRDASTELYNSEEVASFMLTMGFQAIFFGHTHRSYIDLIPGKLVTRSLSKQRGGGRIWKRIIPKMLLNRFGANRNTPVSYKREFTKEGKPPTLESYFLYRYLKDIEKLDGIKGPGAFDTPKQFYNYLDQQSSRNTLRHKIEALRKQKVLISMAPSACQEEAKRKGFHYFEFKIIDNVVEEIAQDVYEFIDGTFVKLNPYYKVYKL
jgi:predicted phosphodiesterase